MKKSAKKTELEKKLEALPDVSKGKRRQWTLEQDSIILRFKESKGSPAIAKVLGLSDSAVVRRYNELKAAIK